MNFTVEEIQLLSEALQDYAVKYAEMLDDQGKSTLRSEPEKAIDLFKKIVG